MGKKRSDILRGELYKTNHNKPMPFYKTRKQMEKLILEYITPTPKQTNKKHNKHSTHLKKTENNLNGHGNNTHWRNNNS